MWYMNVYQLNPVQFNTNTDIGEFVFICTSININALKVLMFHWKHTCAVDLLHVKCCENMQTQPHRCHETLNSYKTNVFLIQSTILFLSNCLLILWKFRPLMKPFIAWWGCPVACVFCLFHKTFRRKSGIKHKLRMLAYLSFT